MTLEGKGFFIWKIPNCEAGQSHLIASLAKQAELTYVLIKIADTNYAYNIVNGVDLVPAVAAALRARHIQVWGWHYVRGYNPIGEADKAVERVRELGLDGYVIDAEGEYKEPGKAEAARKYMSRLRAGLPQTPIALCSYRFPSYHPQLPWREFLEKSDLNMPQVYWMQSHNAGEQLDRCVREFQAMTPSRPVHPVGAAFQQFGWQATSPEVLDFLDTARALNLRSASFYSWDSCRASLPEVWDTIAGYSWDGEPPGQDITAQYINALNSHLPDSVVNLYLPTAVHVTADRAIQGQAALRNWYHAMFISLLPNAVFTLTGFSGSTSSRHFTWTAVSSGGNVQDGKDTFGLRNGRIAYHYSFFSITP
jgi:hypothetical protein